MKILAVDQARHGAWSIFDTESKELLDYGTFAFDNKKYSFEQATLHIKALIGEVIHAHNIGAAYFEDIQLQKNVQSFKRLAQLQGVLVNLCEENEYRYGIVAPSQWQNFCMARGRTSKEIKQKAKEVVSNGKKKESKILSIQAVHKLFGIETENDNLADAILIGYYVIHNINFDPKDTEEQ